MINEDRPLPKHPKADYYECYAKIVLEELYPEEFSNLEIKDKPDLQTNSMELGIEVTSSIDKDQRNAESLFADIHYNRVRDKAGALKRIEKCGCKLEDFILVGKPGRDSFDLILSSFKEKLKKLNEEYQEVKKNYLFIFSDILADERMIIDAIRDMQQVQKNREKQFYKVFVLVPEECYYLDLYTGDYKIHPIESKAQKARELVLKYEGIK